MASSILKGLVPIMASTVYETEIGKGQSPFNQWEFPLLEKRGIHFLPKMCTAPRLLFFSAPTPYPVEFCAGVQFSRDSIHLFDDQIKIRENREL